MSFLNGILVTDIPRIFNHIMYRGIENNPWPLDRELLQGTLDSSQLERFDKQTDNWYLGNNEIALIDPDTAKLYIRACELHGQPVDIKYVEIIRNSMNIYPEWRRQYAIKSNFWGYDVGECASDYYSSLLSDVIARPELLGMHIYEMLNPNGLFNTIEDVNMYLQKRQEVIEHSPDHAFEGGHMDVIAVYHAPIDV